MANSIWERVTIETENGKVDAVAPVIISASRATDVPAFYSEWLKERLRKGYVKWTNPFNRNIQYVSFENTRAIILWTKDARPMMRSGNIDALDNMGYNYYFTYTLNDYEYEKIEPGIPPLKERIQTFIELSEKIGRERVIWRFDPLVLGDDLTAEKLLTKIEKIGRLLHRHTENLVISFIDISAYSSVRRRLDRFGFKHLREPDLNEIKKISSGIMKMNSDWGLKVSTCCEKTDLSAYGISHNKCVDDSLLKKIFWKDRTLMDFLECCSAGSGRGKAMVKDRGQRNGCGCIPSKDIGAYGTCRHGCIYCYANGSRYNPLPK